MAPTFQQFVQPAQEFFTSQKQPYPQAQYEMIDSAQSSPYMPHEYSNAVLSPTFADETKSTPLSHKTRQRYEKIKRTTDVVFGLADLCSCLLTLFIQSVMAYVLVKFYQTRNLPAPGRTSPWATGTKLWPTYMLAGAALVTFILALTSFVMSCSRKRKGAQLTLKVVRFVIAVGCWIAVAAFYRIAKTGKDLWGWSCSDKAAALQQYYVHNLAFETLCNIQTSSWTVSVAEAATKIGFAIIGFYFQFKLNSIKRNIVKDLGKAGWDTFEGLTL